MARKLFELKGEVSVLGIDAVMQGLSHIDKLAQQATRQIDKFANTISKTGQLLTKTVTTPLVAIGGAILFAAEKTGEYADKMLDLKQITGLSTNNLQRLEVLTKLTGGNFEYLTNIIVQFTRKLPTMIKEGSDVERAFRKLNVSLYDSSGHIRTMDELFPELLKSLMSITNITERNVIATQIFGRSLDEIAPILGLTAQEFDTYMKKAEESNQILGEESLKAADKYRESIAEIKNEISFLWKKLAIELIPTLQELIPVIREAITPIFVSLLNTVRGLVGWFTNLNDTQKVVVVTMAGIIATLGPGLIVFANLLKIMKLLAPAIALVNAALLANPFAAAGVAVIALAGAIYGAKKAYDEIIESHREWKVVTAEQAAIDSYIDKIKKLTTSVIQYGDKLKDPQEAQRLLGEDMQVAVDMARDLGYMVEGSLSQKLLRLTTISNALSGSVMDLGKGFVTASKNIDAIVPKTDAQTTAIKKMTDSEIEWQKKLLEQTLAATEGIDEQYQIRLKILSIDKSQAIQTAKDKGNSIANIEKFFAGEEERLQKDRLAQYKAIGDSKVEFEKEWAAKLLEINVEMAKTEEERIKYRLQLLEIEKRDAIKKAQEQHAAIDTIEMFYAQKALQINAVDTSGKIQLEKKYQDLVYQNTTSRLQQIRDEKEKTLQIATELGASKEQIIKYYAQLEREAILGSIGEWLSVTSSTLGQIAQLFAMNTQNKINNLDIQAQKEIQVVNQSKMNEIEKANAIKAINEEVDKEKKKLQREDAKRQKAFAIFSAIINTAQAVSKMLTLAWPLNLIMSVLVGILGAGQIAMIAAQPIPMAKGAYVKSNKKNGVQAQIGEGEENELVLPMKTGVKELATQLIEKVRPFAPSAYPIKKPGLSLDGAYGDTFETHTHLHVGTLVADETGLKELEKTLYKYRRSEEMRRGGL